MDIWIVVVVVVALSVGGSGRRSICILERLNQVSCFPGPERERERHSTRLGPQQTIVCTTSPKTRDKTRRAETKDRHSTAVKKWDLCGVSLRQRENVMRFYDFISDNRPWNLMDTTWGSLVCCSAPPLPLPLQLLWFDKQIWVCFSCIFLNFRAFSLRLMSNHKTKVAHKLIRSFVAKTNRGKCLARLVSRAHHIDDAYEVAC